MVHKRPAHTSDPSTFLPFRDRLTIVRSHNTRKSIILYITIFLRRLFNHLTGSYIIISLVASSAMSQARRPNPCDIPFHWSFTWLLSYDLFLLNQTMDILYSKYISSSYTCLFSPSTFYKDLISLTKHTDLLIQKSHLISNQFCTLY